MDEAVLHTVTAPGEPAVSAEPEWEYADAEEDRRPQHKSPPSRRGYRVLFALGGACVLVLLVLSLLGQARLTAVNDEAVALQKQISVLEQEQRRRMTETASVPYDSAPTEENVPEMTEDRATVLYVSVEERLGAGIRALLDRFEAYSP